MLHELRKVLWVIVLLCVGAATLAVRAAAQQNQEKRQKEEASQIKNQPETETESATAPAPQPPAQTSPAPKPTHKTRSEAASKVVRTLDDITIEGEIAVPQVLFITSRDFRRFRDDLGLQFLMTPKDVARSLDRPTRLRFVIQHKEEEK